MVLYRIRDWDSHFENNRSREVKRLSYVVLPNSLDGAGYTELVEHKNGAAHYACWVACVIVASRCDPRGTLLRGSCRPHDAASLARVSRIPEVYWREALPRLAALGWIEVTTIADNDLRQAAGDDATTPQEGATLSLMGAAFIEGNGTEQKGTEEKKAAVAAKRFVPPSVSEVEAHCRERGNSVDAEAFVAFYASKGWKVGGAAMRDWKAAVVTWEKRGNGQASAKPETYAERVQRIQAARGNDGDC